MTESDTLEAPFWNKLSTYLSKYEKLICLLLCCLMFAAIPLKILSYGWVPRDDALRHAAHGVNEKSWSDVVLLKPGFHSDHNPGWHSILRFFHRNFGMDQEDLLVFSVISLFLLFNITGLLVVKHPMAWVFAQMALGFSKRMVFGRPFIVTCAAMLFLMYIWSKCEKLSLRNKYILSVIVISLSTWIHGSWYLLLLIPASFMLAGCYKASGHLLVCVLAGTVLGTLFTGDPAAFMRFHFLSPFEIFGENLVNRQLVGEFQAYSVEYIVILIAACIFYFVSPRTDYKASRLSTDPVFMLFMLGALSGTAVLRFWLDWGRVALILWTAYLVSDYIDVSQALKKPRIRYSLFVFVLALTFLLSANDYEDRYTEGLLVDNIDFSRPELKDWVPGNDGIVYSDSMRVFYSHYFLYPNAPWKYSTGFETALMPDEDRQVVRNQGYEYSVFFYEPWILKMRPQDRLIIQAKEIPFEHSMLEWVQGSKSYCIARKKTGKTE